VAVNHTEDFKLYQTALSQTHFRDSQSARPAGSRRGRPRMTMELKEAGVDVGEAGPHAVRPRLPSSSTSASSTTHGAATHIWAA
jgi:hypothetical protein